MIRKAILHNDASAGDLIREELEARPWMQADFARILGQPLQAMNEIINGKKWIPTYLEEER